LLAFFGFCLVLSFTHHVFTLPLDRSLDLSMSGNTQMVMHGWAISAFEYDFLTDSNERTLLHHENGIEMKDDTRRETADLYTSASDIILMRMKSSLPHA